MTLQDYAEAEAIVFKTIQRRHFQPELEEMKERNIDNPQARAEVKTKNSKLKGLNAFVGDDGIIRVGSRLVQAEIGYEAKYPAIMPRKDQVLRAYVRYIHHTEAHAGPKHTLSQLREKVWVMHGMQEVRSSTLLCSTKDFRPEAACLKPSGLFCVWGESSSQSGRIRLNLPK